MLYLSLYHVNVKKQQVFCSVKYRYIQQSVETNGTASSIIAVPRIREASLTKQATLIFLNNETEIPEL